MHFMHIGDALHTPLSAKYGPVTTSHIGRASLHSMRSSGPMIVVSVVNRSRPARAASDTSPMIARARAAAVSASAWSVSKMMRDGVRGRSGEMASWFNRQISGSRIVIRDISR